MAKVKSAHAWPLITVAIFVLVGAAGGCEKNSGSKGRVVLYTSVDEPYARGIVQEFQKQTGIEVVLQTDTEASKSVGLAERLRAEKANPQADVWWGNEPFHTVALAKEGLLAEHESPAAGEIDATYKDAGHRWAGCGLRARVIAIHGNREKDGFVEGLSMADLVQPELSGRVAMAGPTAGTTGGHVSALLVLWGEEKWTKYLKQLRENRVKLLGGNGPVAEAVGRGTVIMGLTDNDDVASAQREGGKLAAGLPDQDGDGTLMIPTTVGLVSGAKNAQGAKKLVDYLLSREVEKKLIEAKFAGWSVRGGEKNQPKAMKVDYGRVVEVMPAAVRKAREILEGRE